MPDSRCRSEMHPAVVGTSGADQASRSKVERSCIEFLKQGAKKSTGCLYLEDTHRFGVEEADPGTKSLLQQQRPKLPLQ